MLFPFYWYAAMFLSSVQYPPRQASTVNPRKGEKKKKSKRYTNWGYFYFSLKHCDLAVGWFLSTFFFLNVGRLTLTLLLLCASGDSFNMCDRGSRFSLVEMGWRIVLGGRMWKRELAVLISDQIQGTIKLFHPKSITIFQAREKIYNAHILYERIEQIFK